jgi:hypothetical protein
VAGWRDARRLERDDGAHAPHRGEDAVRPHHHVRDRSRRRGDARLPNEHGWRGRRPTRLGPGACTSSLDAGPRGDRRARLRPHRLAPRSSARSGPALPIGRRRGRARYGRPARPPCPPRRGAHALSRRTRDHVALAVVDAPPARESSRRGAPAPHRTRSRPRRTTPDARGPAEPRARRARARRVDATVPARVRHPARQYAAQHDWGLRHPNGVRCGNVDLPHASAPGRARRPVALRPGFDPPRSLPARSPPRVALVCLSPVRRRQPHELLPRDVVRPSPSVSHTLPASARVRVGGIELELSVLDTAAAHFLVELAERMGLR